MEREQLEQVAAEIGAVRVVLNMTAFEHITDGERARMAFWVLAQHRATLSKRLRLQGRYQPLVSVVWPREEAEQAQVLRYLSAECDRLEEALAGGPAQAAA